MRLFVACFVFALNFITASAALHAQTRTDNPVYHANQLLDVLERDGAKAVSDTLGEALENKDAASAIQSILTPMEKRKAKFRAVALDRDYGGAVRQIIVYQYMLSEQFPFIYFRFVYKMTDQGWRMSHFSVDSENSQPFPSKYDIN
ncbi:hypothetical protein AB4097_18650 [Microvirga sp. 2MCAF35]|uniref:hypothetical protein n=1 Tax=Microvirga sp. 2MCAF35 TaxID=3232987 RepID=UPI003F9A7BD7